VPRRKLGYYALPLLWRDRIVGWGNLSVKDDTLQSTFGYIGAHAPRGRAFRLALEQELDRFGRFLSRTPEP
jgi:uncharacterized protein YcaQ